MEEINLRVSISGHLEHAIFRLVRCLQGVIAWLPTLFVNVMVWDTRNSFLRLSEEGHKIFRTKAGRVTISERTLDEMFWRHRIWRGRWGRWISKLQALIRNDCVDGRKVYEKLIQYSPGSKHIGLTQGDMISGIEWLGRATDHGVPWEFNWIREIRVAGNFLLVCHEIENDVVICRCAWLSGGHAGKIFQVKPDHAGSLEPFVKGEKGWSGITGMYFPPAPILWILELTKILVSASVLLGVIKGIKEIISWALKSS